MNKAIKNHILLLLPLFFAAVMNCAFEDQTLVTVAGDKYTVADFKETYQFLTTEDSLQRVKKFDEFVDQMLFVKEAKSRGYDKDTEVLEAYETHKKDVVGRGYYEASVIDRIKVSDIELRQVYSKLVDQYHLAQIVVESESLAHFIEEELAKGVVFDSLLHFSLDTITENGDIGVFSAMQLPPEIMDQIENMDIGGTTTAIKFGEFYYILKILEHSTADSPEFEMVRAELESNIKNEKAREESQKFIERLLEEAHLEYNDKGLEVLLKPDSLITEEDLNTWVLRKSFNIKDTSMVYVRTLRKPVMLQYKQSFIDPKLIIERVLIPDLIYEKALMVHFDKNAKVKRELDNSLGLLIYQKFYRDEILSNITVDSLEIVDYYNDHPDQYKGKKLTEVFFAIRIKLRDAKIGRKRAEYNERLHEKYEVVINQPVLKKMFEEAK
jgi:hypothetical protein